MKQVVIIFGPPGAGKGVQSELLAEKLSYYHLESSKVIENCFKKEGSEKIFEIDGQTFKVADEKNLWETGVLNSPPFVVELMRERITEISTQDEESLILSGSPRTLYEAEKLVPVLEELYGKENIKVIFLEISAETTLWRNSKRKICELMRHSILFSNETENLTLCPLDGSLLKKREKLDDPETIKVRLKEYAERTAPIMDFYGTQGIKVNHINGEKTIAEVHAEVMKVVQ
jgi:adenylate kinase